jgi:hypothetical protein
MPVCFNKGFWFAVLAVLLLTACAVRQPAEPPSVIYENAHSGGSVVVFSGSGDVLASGGWEGGVRLCQMINSSSPQAMTVYWPPGTGAATWCAGSRPRHLLCTWCWQWLPGAF